MRRITMLLGALVVFACAFLSVVSLQLVRWVEQTFYPVTVQWRAASVYVAGDDLIVAGTQVKARGCNYVPPPRAFAETGEPLVVRSLSKTAGQNWPPGPQPRPFGPWVILDAAGKTVTLYQEHECHPMWSVWSKLGTVNADGQIPP